MWSTSRPPATSRGYGYQHRKRRRAIQRDIDAGVATYCWRCGDQLLPGDEWHLGHDDYDRTIYRGAECSGCNVKAAARKANQQRQPRPEPATYRETQTRSW